LDGESDIRSYVLRNLQSHAEPQDILAAIVQDIIRVTAEATRCGHGASAGQAAANPAATILAAADPAATSLSCKTGIAARTAVSRGVKVRAYATRAANAQPWKTAKSAVAARLSIKQDAIAEALGKINQAGLIILLRLLIALVTLSLVTDCFWEQSASSIYRVTGIPS
jgi:hypothetical protein